MIDIRLTTPPEGWRKIGRGVPSGRGGKWRVIDILTRKPLKVFYQGSIFGVKNAADWERLPDEGVQVITAEGGIWKNADEYRYFGESPKFGIYLMDKQYDEIMRLALG